MRNSTRQRSSTVATSPSWPRCTSIFAAASTCVSSEGAAAPTTNTLRRSRAPSSRMTSSDERRRPPPQVHVETHGEPDVDRGTIVMVHGSWTDGTTWRFVVPELLGAFVAGDVADSLAANAERARG